MVRCEICNNSDIIKQNGEFICRSCGCKYSTDEMKRILQNQKRTFSPLENTSAPAELLYENDSQEEDVTIRFLALALPIAILVGIVSLLVFIITTNSTT